MEVENKDTVVEQETTSTADTQQERTTEQSEKTFTQAEVDKIVTSRLSRATKEMPSEDELKKFKQWQETQKTQDEKIQQERQEFEKIKIENSMLRAEKQAIAFEVKPEFAEFVATKALQMGESIEDNLKEIKESCPQYFGETVIKKASTSNSLAGGNATPQLTGVEKAFMERNPGLKI